MSGYQTEPGKIQPACKKFEKLIKKEQNIFLLQQMEDFICEVLSRYTHLTISKQEQIHDVDWTMVRLGLTLLQSVILTMLLGLVLFFVINFLV